MTEVDYVLPLDGAPDSDFEGMRKERRVAKVPLRNIAEALYNEAADALQDEDDSDVDFVRAAGMKVVGIDSGCVLIDAECILYDEEE